MKNYHFPQQKASDECPEVPKAVMVVADTLAEATGVLKQALESDAKLEKEHPEFADPSLRSKEPAKTAPVESKKQQTRKP